MQHIVIDARLYGPKHTGLGRYTKNLLIALKNLPDFKKYRFTLIVYKNLIDEIRRDLGTNFTYVAINTPHYSIREQLFFPLLLRQLHPNLVHFTHLDKPIFYFGKSVVTVHDLIRHFSKGFDTTTNPILYWPKYIGYLLMTRIVLLTSSIIVPSNFWKNYIIDHYHLGQNKITTTYEAVDPDLLKSSAKNPVSSVSNYLLYTGNLYPHKNIKVIFEALKSLPNLTLKIICARDIFSRKSFELAKKIGIEKRVEFLGHVPDKEFGEIYSHALALVHPALVEGFSLTGLEAMALNCPVITSNATCMPEVYGESVLYFEPNHVDELVSQIKVLQNNPKVRQRLVKLGAVQVAKYSWTKTASETLKFYEQILR